MFITCIKMKRVCYLGLVVLLQLAISFYWVAGQADELSDQSRNNKDIKPAEQKQADRFSSRKPIESPRLDSKKDSVSEQSKSKVLEKDCFVSGKATSNHEMKKWIKEDLEKEVFDLQSRNKIESSIQSELLEIDKTLVKEGYKNKEIRKLNRRLIRKLNHKQRRTAKIPIKDSDVEVEQLTAKLIVLRILSEPQGARVEINDIYLDDTPCSTILKAGELVKIAVSLEGYQSEIKYITPGSISRHQLENFILKKL